MADLTGTKIKDTYPGLIKTNDNGPLGATASALTDGLGNELPLQLSQTDVNFTNNVDFTGATVSGLIIPNDLPEGGTTGQVLSKIDETDYNVEWTTVEAGGTPGLVAGTGVDSMKSSDALTTTPANASNTNTIALGNNARATASGAITLGTGFASGANSISLGNGAIASGDSSIIIGNGVTHATIGGQVNIVTIGRASRGAANGLVVGADNIALSQSQHLIGHNLRSNQSFFNINIGSSTNISLNGDFVISMGYTNNIGGVDSIAIGRSVTVRNGGIAIGQASNAQGTNQPISIGQSANASGDRAVALGHTSVASASGSVALGRAVTAATVDTTTTRKLQLVDTVAMDYVDDAAAAIEGVPVGGIYHTSGTLKIRLT